MADPMKSMEADSPRAGRQPVSKKTYPIAGITTTVFGLDELPPQASKVACLWLLHPRLGTQERMAGIAVAAISDWNNRVRDGRAGIAGGSVKGLIAVSFDQRNHGTRMVDPLGNEAWKQGNPRHAQDMFSIFHGTARDVSILMDHLPSYVFPKSEHKITDHLVLGVSLGGHATWNCILHEPRVTTGVVIIGCPDYVNLMADRARLSKLPSWTNSDPPGSQFLGSEAFPFSLLETVCKYDPASLFLSHTGSAISASSSPPLRNDSLPEPNTKEQHALRPLLTRCLAGKRILNLSGGVDKSVPYHRGEAFLAWLKRAVAPGGWFGDGAVTLEDIIDERAGHEVTTKMADEAIRFISESLAAHSGGGSGQTGFVRESKM